MGMAHTNATRPLDPDPLASTARGYRFDTFGSRAVHSARSSDLARSSAAA
jgi:hypothetical protein